MYIYIYISSYISTVFPFSRTLDLSATAEVLCVFVEGTLVLKLFSCKTARVVLISIVFSQSFVELAS